MKMRINSGLAAIVTGTILSLGWQTVALAQWTLSREFTGVKRIAVLPPRIDVYEVTVGGNQQRVDDWSVRARENVLAALAHEFKARSEIESDIEGMVITNEALTDDQRTELEQANLLLNAVVASFDRHILGPNQEVFDNKVGDFQYCLGGETQKLNVNNADALLFVNGYDNISSAGRRALHLTSALAGAALRGLIIPASGAGLAALAFTLVDAKSGDILWYGTDSGAAATDLRDSSSAASLVNSVFRKFPVGVPYFPPQKSRDS